MLSFIEETADRANSLFGKVLAEPSPKKDKQQTPRSSARNVFSSQSLQVETKTTCVSCGANHALWECDTFRNLTVKDRWYVVKAKRLCFKCLKSNHVSRDCTFRRSCAVCKRPHHTLFHKDVPQKRNRATSTADDASPFYNASSSSAPTANITAFAKTSSQRVRLMVLPVRVFGEDPTNFTDTYTFLDSGSEVSFCTNALLRRLHLRGKPVTKEIVSINGSSSHSGTLVSLSRRGLMEKDIVEVANVLRVETLPRITESIPTDQDVDHCKHLEGLHFPEIPFAGVEILIGAGVLQAQEIATTRSGSMNQPRAVKTGLG